MLRVIVLAVLIVINFTLQSTLFGFHDINSITPNLLLILTMSFGLMRGRREGMLVGFFSGFLVDSFFSSVLGPYMFLYMIIGYVNGFFHKNYIVENVLLPLIVIIIDDIIFNFFVYIVSFLLKNRLEFGLFFTRVIIPEMLTTSLLTIIIYKFYVFVNRLLKKSMED
ncbi:MAG: rod shape-determining protein MreD [Clostridium sp.]|nr:rod shape-determining protein MreD [Clostridium sp.]MCM1171125.1 rod shape-determining protein MreD [Clostridium sp.]MCM1208467.1 rod shape-determining protein MreD [Ruminococcus sp.]